MINLCFHGIGECRVEREPGEAHYWVGHEAFLGILDEVAGHDHVRLSFDDGNKSDVTIGLPALVDRGLTATFFVLAGRLDDPASLDSDDLQALGAAGMTLGSHGWAHVPWRGLSADRVRQELVEARSALAAASGFEIEEAALPLGRYDRRLLRQLKGLGYRTVYTSDRFPARPGSWLQARYSVVATDTAASIRTLITGRSGLGEVRNRLASVAKRLR